MQGTIVGKCITFSLYSSIHCCSIMRNYSEERRILHSEFMPCDIEISKIFLLCLLNPIVDINDCEVGRQGHSNCKVDGGNKCTDTGLNSYSCGCVQGFVYRTNSSLQPVCGKYSIRIQI